jgi:hypothetical protein
MSSSKRPGTVDYSKWDHFECSSDEEEEDFEAGGSNHYHNDEEEEYDDDSEEESEEEEEVESSSEEEEELLSSDNYDNRRIVAPRRDAITSRAPVYQRRTAPAAAPPSFLPMAASLPSLAELQRAWNTDLTTIDRPCSNCFAPNAQYRCSRCQLVRYCNVFCQSTYHPIHKLECIDAGQHQKYWGMFETVKKKSGEEKEGEVPAVNDFVALRARRSSKRRECISWI